MTPAIRLLPLLVLFHLPISLSSRHHRHRTPSASPSPAPASSDSAPLAVLLACNATRFQPACVSTLSGAASDASTADLLAATLSALRARLPPAVSTAKSVLASSSNVNLTNAATNCLTFLALSSHRLSPSSPSPSLLSASTALLHFYDCWSAYKSSIAPAPGLLRVKGDGGASTRSRGGASVRTGDAKVARVLLK